MPGSTPAPESNRLGDFQSDNSNCPLKICSFAAFALALCLFALGAGCRPEKPTVTIGCKKGPEQLLLGHLILQVAATNPHVQVAQKLEFGDTAECFAALKSGQLDVYPEYTQTALERILKQAPKRNREAVLKTVKDLMDARHHIACLPPLGYGPARVLLIRRELSAKHMTAKISDLRFLSRNMIAGFTPDFLDDPECYAALCAAYGLSFKQEPRRQEQGKLYRSLAAGRLDVISGFSTDIFIENGDAVILADDFSLFPRNDVCLLVRQTLLNEVPSLEFTLKKLSHLLDDRALRRLKMQIIAGKKDPSLAASAFLASSRAKQ